MPAKTAPRRSRTTILDRAACIAHNLWWTWNPEARHLFESIDPAQWEATGHNPIATLHAIDDVRRETLEADADFARAVDAVEAKLKAYREAKTWYQRTARGRATSLQVAYFCMEYAVHESLPLYAGGLGVLAGDHLKSASDLGIPLVGVGILWKHGYYRQEIRLDGEVRVLYPENRFDRLPVTDTGRSVTVPIGRARVKARIWKMTIGRVELLLLDTDIPGNKPADRTLTHHLYGGDRVDRIRQEILLGIGGLMALDAMKITPTVCHLNEGHAAFAGLERVRRLMAAGRSFEDARAAVRASSVFTTHTPVPEGNDRFETGLFMKYLGGFATELGLRKQELLALGREDEGDTQEPFCMTVLALKLSDHCNGVAELHADTSRRMWMKTYHAATPEEVPIRHVTNGIHVETWLADEARPFYDRYLKPRWVGAGPEQDWWKGIDKAPREEIWALRQLLRRRLVAYLREQMRRQILYHGGDTPMVRELYETLDEDALTIGFARRFALYKRAPLIFSDAKRLARIMGDADRPVQLIFAGKAHPQDTAGHEFVRRVQSFARKPPFRGRVFLLQNYDMAIGRQLTQGCDLWLNNPIRPMEASGTSGMKPPLNAGLNFSILDGWWPEGFNGRNGWAIGTGEAQPTRARQDKADATSIYETLESRILPAFYERNSAGVPDAWIDATIESMKSICARFSTHRMLAEYTEGFYLPAHGR